VHGEEPRPVFRAARTATVSGAILGRSSGEPRLLTRPHLSHKRRPLFAWSRSGSRDWRWSILRVSRINRPSRSLRTPGSKARPPLSPK
jgi:hypothetical protein